MVNVVASFFFGGISGSSSADCASLGPIEIKMMEEQGYDREFSTCLTMASSVEGILVPPSQNMVIYTLAAAGVTSVSIGQLFLAGYVPGAVLSLTLMVYSYYYSKKHDIPVTGRFDIVKCARSFMRAIWGMLSVLFVVVGVIAGVFTTTESAACAVVWSLIVGLFIYKGFGLKDIPGIFHNVTMTLGKVLILLGVSGAFTYLLTYLKVPEQVSGVLFSITDNKILILIMLNVLMLLLGCLIEMACLILMLTPVILPIWMSLGCPRSIWRRDGSQPGYRSSDPAGWLHPVHRQRDLRNQDREAVQAHDSVLPGNGNRSSDSHILPAVLHVAAQHGLLIRSDLTWHSGKMMKKCLLS